MDIGHRMKELRIQYGLTQQELADRAEPVSYTHLDVYKRQFLPCSIHSFLYVPATGCWKRVGFVELPVMETPTFS